MRIGDGLVPTEVTKTQGIAGTTPSPPRYRHIHESALRVPTHRFLPLQASTPSIDSELDDAFAAHWRGSGQAEFLVSGKSRMGKLEKKLNRFAQSSDVVMETVPTES